LKPIINYSFSIKHTFEPKINDEVEVIKVYKIKSNKTTFL
jgi:hypothetical protein